MSVREIQQVTPVPRMVFVRPAVGRLEDLTSTCVSTLHHAADTFVLNNDDVSSFAVPPVEPPLLAIEYQQPAEEGLPPSPHCPCWRPQHYPLGRYQHPPPIVTMARKDPNGSPWI